MMENNQTTTGFGFNQLAKPTPLWAKTVFRVVTVMTTALAIWAASTSLLPQNAKIKMMLDLKVLDVIVLGLSKMFGENATANKPDDSNV